jgi:Domain of unknown function (DUF6916)
VDRSLISSNPKTLTRRTLLRTGAAAAAATMLGLRPWAAAPAAAASGGHLVRSAYAGLVGRRFAVGSAKLRLKSISDVAGAARDASLVGSEDAFVLTFSGPLAQPLESGTHTLRHPDLGTFELFISPVKRPSTDCLYEAVIDRSVGVSKSLRRRG